MSRPVWADQAEETERIFRDLTPSKLRVFALIVEGLSNKEIAQRLNRTEQSIKNDLRCVYIATGTANARQLLALTYKNADLLDALRENLTQK